jgi:hypothetical protein
MDVQRCHLRLEDPRSNDRQHLLTVIVEVDLERVGRDLLLKALRNKRGECVYMNGGVKVKVLPEDPSCKAAQRRPDPNE